MVFSTLIDAYAITLALSIYTLVYQILASTGLIFWGFIRYFSKLGAEAAESSSESSKSSVNSMLVSMLIMVFSLGLFVAPIIPLQTNDFQRITSTCVSDSGGWGGNSQGNVQYIYSDLSPSLADDFPAALAAVTDIQTVQAPVVLTIFLRLAQGITSQIEHRLPCEDGIKFLPNIVSSSSIIDANLIKETQDFMRWCYNPAVNKASRNMEFPHKERAWPGAMFWMSDNYYRNSWGEGFYARRPIYGFAGNSNPIPNATGLPEGAGFPTCYQWWNGGQHTASSYLSAPSHSLSRRLYQQIDSRVQDRAQHIHESLKDLGVEGHSPEASVLRATLFNPQRMEGLNSGFTRDTMHSYEWMAKSRAHLLSENSLTANNLQILLPIIKPFFIVVVLAIAPMIYVSSSYNFKVIGTSYLFITSVLLWPVIWSVGFFIESSLLSLFGINPYFEIFSSGSQSGWQSSSFLSTINSFLVWTFFIIFPAMVSIMFIWIGLSSGSAMNKLSTQSAKSR